MAKTKRTSREINTIIDEYLGTHLDEKIKMFCNDEFDDERLRTRMIYRLLQIRKVLTYYATEKV